MTIGYAATEPGGELKKFEYDLGPLGDHQVDVKVENCGICHSDVSMLDNHWGMTTYPFVPGHEIIGTVEAVGSHVKHLAVGQRVGVGWESKLMRNVRKLHDWSPKPLWFQHSYRTGALWRFF